MIPGASRGIRIIERKPRLTLVGRVAAGSSDPGARAHRGSLSIPADFFHPKADFLLEVRGDSMIKIGIFEGDLIAVPDKTQVARNGEIVVARVGEEVTKTL